MCSPSRYAGPAQPGPAQAGDSRDHQRRGGEPAGQRLGGGRGPVRLVQLTGQGVADDGADRQVLGGGLSSGRRGYIISVSVTSVVTSPARNRFRSSASSASSASYPATLHGSCTE